VTSPQKITDENAESIGRPIFDKVIKSFINSNREEFIQHFPYLDDWITVDIFDEAVNALNRLGELQSTEYSTRTIKNENHVLLWNAHYKNDENTVHWKLFLDDSREQTIVKGFEFDR